MKTLANRIKRLREERGWSQTELARRMGTSPGLVSHIEVGRNLPKLETLIKFAEALSVPLSDLARAIEEDLALSRKEVSEKEGSPQGALPHGLGSRE